MGKAGRYHTLPSRALPPPPASARDRAITIPAGDQTIKATVAWAGFAVNRGIKVHVKNIGGHACELLGVYPDGADHLLRPGRTAQLTVADGCQDLLVPMRSASGTAVVIEVPSVLARKKTVVRDDASQLIEHVIEVPVWVPAP